MDMEMVICTCIRQRATTLAYMKLVMCRQLQHLHVLVRKGGRARACMHVQARLHISAQMCVHTPLRAHTLARLRAQVTVPLTAGARTSTIRVTGANVQQGTQKFALVVSGPLTLESPPPAPPSPPGPQGPAPPPAPAGDTVVLGVSLPLLVLAVAAGGGFAFTRMRRGSAPAAGGPGGGLPAGWRMLTDPSSGYAYYVGPSGQTQWEAPVQELKPTAAPPPPPGGTALPAGWTTGVDPSSGAKYYYNPSTKQSQWTPP